MRQRLFNTDADDTLLALLALHGAEEGDDDGDDGGNDDGDSSGDGDDGDDGDDGSDDDGNDGEQQSKDPRVRELSAENARRRNEAKQLKKERDALAARLQEIDDADKSELEKATGQLNELKTQTETQAATIQRLMLENAFLSTNSISWHDPELAMKEIDLSEVTDDDGEVDAKSLKAAIKKLATDKPFLVKKGEDGDGGPSGSHVGGNGRRRSTDADRAKLESRYPALRR